MKDELRCAKLVHVCVPDVLSRIVCVKRIFK